MSQSPPDDLTVWRPEFVVYRVALLPFERYARWTRSRRCDSFAELGGRLAEHILLEYHDSRLRLALACASPSLSATLLTADSSTQLKRRALQALARYFGRCTTRATPFGLFSAQGVGKIASSCSFDLAGTFGAALTADCGVLYDTIDQANAARSGRYMFNNVSFPLGSRLKWAKRHFEGKHFRYEWRSAALPPWLLELVSSCQPGVLLADIAHQIASTGVEATEATIVAGQLVDEQVLVPVFDLPLYSADTACAIMEMLNGHMAPSPMKAHVGVPADLCALTDRASRSETRFDIASSAPAIRDPIEHYQLDGLELTRTFAIDEFLASRALAAASLLWRIQPRPAASRLDRFKGRLVEFYPNVELPLLIAVDDEVGVGYGHNSNAVPPVLRGLRPANPALSSVSEFTGRDAALAEILCQSLEQGRSPMELTDDLAESLVSFHPPALPDTLTIAISVLASSASGAEQPTIVHRFTSAGSAARLFGRFTQSDNRLRRRVDEYFTREERLNPDAIHAEVLHLAAPRNGNVSRRSPLRKYAIPIWGAAGIDANVDPILPDDLVVSVRNDRVVLRSLRLNREVIPTFTTALTFANSGLKAVQFLYDYALQGGPGGITWSWGCLGNTSFLPRITSKGCVLSPARWKLRPIEWPKLSGALSEEEYHVVVGTLHGKGVPTWFGVVEGDNILPVHVDNPLSLEAALTSRRNADESVTLVELMFDDLRSVVRTPEGTHSHEILIPFVRRQPVNKVRANVRPYTLDCQRRFPPGSEWLTAKLYAGPFLCDRLLQDVVQPLVARGRAAHVFDRWHFLRYADPEHHIRLRFHGKPNQLFSWWSDVYAEWLAPLVAASNVKRIELAEYIPELARYGGLEGIDLAEEVFEHVSDWVLDILSTLRRFGSMDERWLVGTSMVDRLLNGAALPLDAKHNLAKSMSERLVDTATASIPSAKAPLRRLLARRFREHRADVEAALVVGDNGSRVQACLSAIRTYEEPVRSLLQRTAATNSEHSHSGVAIIQSHVHMALNRLFDDHHAQWELFIYDCLDRFYWSQISRRECSLTSC